MPIARRRASRYPLRLRGAKPDIDRANCLSRVTRAVAADLDAAPAVAVPRPCGRHPAGAVLPAAPLPHRTPPWREHDIPCGPPTAERHPPDGPRDDTEDGALAQHHRGHEDQLVPREMDRETGDEVHQVDQREGHEESPWRGGQRE